MNQYKNSNENIECNNQQFTKGYSYTIYIGLNDMYTNTQIIDEKTALNIVINTCNKYLPGYTIIRSMGGYKDSTTGKSYTECGFSVYTVDVPLESIEKISGIFNMKFNQSSVLIQRSVVQYEFYTNRSCGC